MLSSEDGSDFEDLLEISHHAHLLVELGRLGKTGLLVEVLELEDVGSSFGRSGDQLWGVNFDKILAVEVFSEELSDSTLDSEDGLLGRCSQIQNTVVESDLLSDGGLLISNLLLFDLLLSGNLVVSNSSGGVLELERQDGD